MSELGLWELLEGAKINFENVVKMNPALGNHPIYQIAMSQLEDAIKKAEAEEQPNG